MEAAKKSYPTDLTDSQWELVKDLIPAAGKGGRKRTVDIRKHLRIDSSKIPKHFADQSYIDK